MNDQLAQSRRRLGRVGLGLALSCTPWAVCAKAVAGVQGGSGGADGSPWLARIQQAAADTNYQGTLMFSAGGVVSSSRRSEERRVGKECVP